MPLQAQVPGKLEAAEHEAPPDHQAVQIEASPYAHESAGHWASVIGVGEVYRRLGNASPT
jgi:hypothetical protein